MSVLFNFNGEIECFKPYFNKSLSHGDNSLLGELSIVSSDVLCSVELESFFYVKCLQNCQTFGVAPKCIHFQ